jgi:steryl-sulfatase
MDWFPTLATFAGITIPTERVLDGRDMQPLLLGETETIPDPTQHKSLNAEVPLRRPWDPPAEWASLVTQNDYLNAFFYHGAEGQLAAVRWGKWKLTLNPSLQLFDLEADPAENTPVRHAQMQSKLRGMAIMFQQEMNVQK